MCYAGLRHVTVLGRKPSVSPISNRTGDYSPAFRLHHQRLIQGGLACAMAKATKCILRLIDQPS